MELLKENYNYISTQSVCNLLNVAFCMLQPPQLC